MKNILSLTEEIKSTLAAFSGKYESILKEKMELILSNEELKKENEALKSECKNALFEIEKCLISIESMKKNGNNNN